MKSTDAVTAYRENLPPGDLIDFPYRRLDRLGIPAYSTAFWPEEGSFCNGLGYGTSEAEAMTSAFGELFESVAAGDKLPLMPRVHGTYDELVRHYGDDGVLDPVESCLDAGTAYDHDRVLDWVEARRFPGGGRTRARGAHGDAVCGPPARRARTRAVAYPDHQRPRRRPEPGARPLPRPAQAGSARRQLRRLPGPGSGHRGGHRDHGSRDARPPGAPR